jgi:hypothetical protein
MNAAAKVAVNPRSPPGRAFSVLAEGVSVDRTAEIGTIESRKGAPPGRLKSESPSLKNWFKKNS